MNTELFSQTQIDALRKEYQGIKTISTENAGKLSAMVGRWPSALVSQVAGLAPRIPFVSTIAINEEVRRGLR